MKNNISLIGFMATGKTFVGKNLAQKLDKEYVDVDSLIVKESGKSIPRIFEEDGEIRFRELEMEIVKKVSGRKDIVIDCGGGVVLNKINIDRLKQNSNIILLTASPEVILERILKEKGKRPLLEIPDRMEEIKRLLSFREPFYNRSCDYKIDTSNLTVDEVVDKILKIFWEGKYEDNNKKK